MAVNTVIVAIPEQTDQVWKVSSEKVPHMTLLFLGETNQVADLGKVLSFVEHAAGLLDPFWMETDYRGTLGPDQADVLFFERNWDFKQIAQFRDQLLQNKAIKAAYNSIQQYDEWTPHLTLGYPTAPAKETDRDLSLFSVRFDRIAVWTGDFTGPEFRLKRNEGQMDSFSETAPISMSSDDAKSLFHYGVKGMKWGIRKSDSGGGTDKALTPTPGGAKGRLAMAKAANDRARAAKKTTTPVTAIPTHTKSGKALIKTEGGTRQPAHPDAIQAAKTKQQLNASGIKSLSNKELQDLAQRLNLEQQVNRLSPPPPTFTQKVLKTALKDPVKSLEKADRAYKTELGKKVVKFATARKVAKVAAATL